MACGCYVVGFTGLAGREFFYDGLCVTVEEDNVLAFARAVEDTLLRFDRDASAMRGLAREGAERIGSDYSPERQRAELQAFYESLKL
jgi:glycosyltransferase involved in cell wall biosynthesis